MLLHELFSLVAIVLTVMAFAPYVREIRKGVSKPHHFSWLIWSLTTAIVFLAQLAAGGGTGAWPTGVSALITFYVTWLVFVHYSGSRTTGMDWGFLVAALASLPVWFFTSDPLWSVVILTTVDVLGFGPTLRKSWHLPFEESFQFYLLFAVRSGLSVLALESVNLTTVLFPLAMIASSIAVCSLLLWRRKVLASLAAK